ncbi:type I glyceraldehyde-3-phosphate dehydrogenase [Pseudoteredinibacter isoporae]|uniref:type I glyceraldehyde-3-phosphate dehydrogenase n=1 Tax=Pseudoteredinibacter isoporae TaxID=570281 RepID=UPI00310C7C89
MRVAINGFGRIGRSVCRAYFESELSEALELVAINDLGDAEMNAHLFQYDSVHGSFNGDVQVEGNALIVDGKAVRLLQQANAEALPWKDLGVDLVLECSGRFTRRELAEQHIRSGAKKVLISAPADGVDRTVVFGVNDHELSVGDTIISNASCTTNCLAPIAKHLHEVIGIEDGLMTTIHAYTNDQNVQDSYHNDPYRARAAALSLIPSKTGAAKAVSHVLPELTGKLDGMAVRVPVANVSLVDLSFLPSRDTTVEEVNATIRAAAQSHPDILGYNDRPLVSCDFNHSSLSSCFDAGQTKVSNSMVKVLAWYDNEWGFSNRMLDVSMKIKSLL